MVVIFVYTPPNSSGSPSGFGVVFRLTVTDIPFHCNSYSSSLQQIFRFTTIFRNIMFPLTIMLFPSNYNIFSIFVFLQINEKQQVSALKSSFHLIQCDYHSPSCIYIFNKSISSCLKHIFGHVIVSILSSITISS